MWYLEFDAVNRKKYYFFFDENINIQRIVGILIISIGIIIVYTSK